MKTLIHRCAHLAGWLVLALVALGLVVAPVFAADWVVAPVSVHALPPPPPPGFQTIPGTAVDVHVHPGEEKLGLILSRHAAASLPRLAEALAVPIGDRVAVFVAQDDDEFHAMQPGRTPEWADATAWPERGSVYLRRPRARQPEARPLGTVLDHELVHVLVGRAFEPKQPPRWLQEGLAQVYANELGPHTAEALTRGAAESRWYTLEELHLAFPRDASDAAVAYAESGDFVGWMRDEYGDAGIQTLIRGLVAGRTIDGAVYGVTGQPLAKVERAWRSHLDLEGTTRWLTLGTWFFGVLLVALFVGVGFQRRRRQRHRIERMIAREEREAEILAAIERERASWHLTAPRPRDDGQGTWH